MNLEVYVLELSTLAMPPVAFQKVSAQDTVNGKATQHAIVYEEC